MTQEVFELHNLLQAAKIPAPNVLVGHSIGGLPVRLYTEQYGKDVIGLVLVDPTHESSVLFNHRRIGLHERLGSERCRFIGQIIKVHMHHFHSAHHDRSPQLSCG
jgi:pimeloyl-ACP methyl ester carboxylesterase